MFSLIMSLITLAIVTAITLIGWSAREAAKDGCYSLEEVYRTSYDYRLDLFMSNQVEYIKRHGVKSL